MAVPSRVAKSTVTVAALGADRVTGKTRSTPPESPSATPASPIDRLVASSFRIVPSPVASAMPAPTGFERSTKKTSSASTTRSPLTVTVTVLAVSPGAKLSPPAAAW